MTGLERKALLGDEKAQQKCTENESMLPCPICGGTPNIKVQKVEYGLSGTIIRCSSCGIYMYSPDKKSESILGTIRNVPVDNHKEIGIRKWNTRHAPPNVRCIDCVHLSPRGTKYGYCKEFAKKEIHYFNDYCSRFEPKDRE